MYVVCVTVFTLSEHAEDFLAATLVNARNTRKEAGNVRFDVLRAEEDPNRFFLYEAYLSKDSFAAHQKTDHYLAWKEVVKDWMAQPRQGIKHRSQFFGDGEG